MHPLQGPSATARSLCSLEDLVVSYLCPQASSPLSWPQPVSHSALMPGPAAVSAATVLALSVSKLCHGPQQLSSSSGSICIKALCPTQAKPFPSLTLTILSVMSECEG